jgi:hypothetical protein
LSHPRFASKVGKEVVDARDKCGHDGVLNQQLAKKLVRQIPGRASLRVATRRQISGGR